MRRHSVLAVLLVLLMLLVSACGGGSGSASGEPEAGTTTVTETNSAAEGASETDTQPDSDSGSAEGADVGQNKDAEESKPPLLPGLNPVDITLNLEPYPYEFEFGNWVTGQTFRSKCGSRMDTDTMSELSVCIYSTFTTNVSYVDASVTAFGGDLSAARWFLPYLATLPYDGSDPQAAKAWVEENLDNIQEGEILTAEFGPAVYELYGNGSTAVFLRIKPIGLDEWMTKALLGG